MLSTVGEPKSCYLNHLVFILLCYRNLVIFFVVFKPESQLSSPYVVNVVHTFTLICDAVFIIFTSVYLSLFLGFPVIPFSYCIIIYLLIKPYRSVRCYNVQEKA